MRSSLFELARFGSVGVLATCVHYLAALAATSAVGPYFANGFGYCTALLVSYLGHQRFTFRVPKGSREHRRQFPRFVISSLSALLFSQVVLAGVLGLGVREPIALVVAILSIPPVTFLLGRFWVYR